MNKKALAFATLLTLSPFATANQTLDAAVGGAVGGALGGAVGAELGGRDGAIIGAGIGAAAGTAMTTREYSYDRPHYPKKQKVYHNHHYYAHPHGRFCPPGLAKQGRC